MEVVKGSADPCIDFDPFLVSWSSPVTFPGSLLIVLGNGGYIESSRSINVGAADARIMKGVYYI